MAVHRPRLVDPLPLSRRKYLANILGGPQGKVGRLQLINLAKQYPDKVESPELKFKGPHKIGMTEYFQHPCNAKFSDFTSHSLWSVFQLSYQIKWNCHSTM